ncbi:MAG TPA: hypothetical protein VKB18_02105 [Gemmatimonadota bacterium]|nr:hypothetical protein [Gemmatimonadota bacterium]
MWRYVIYHLNAEGALEERYLRGESWFPDEQEVTRTRLRRMYTDRPPLVYLEHLTEDANGRVWTFSLVPDAHWKPGAPETSSLSWTRRTFDTVVEVLDLTDPSRAHVVSRRRFDSVVAPVCGHGLLLYRMVETPAGDTRGGGSRLRPGPRSRGRRRRVEPPLTCTRIVRSVSSVFVRYGEETMTGRRASTERGTGPVHDGSAEPLGPEARRELGDEIERFAALLGEEKRELLEKLAVFDRLRGWERAGYRSCADWLAASAAMDLPTARAQVQAARILAAVSRPDAKDRSGRSAAPERRPSGSRGPVPDGSAEPRRGRGRGTPA